MEKDIITTIRRLLALGTSNNANEASNAIAAAQALMDKYRIEMCEVEAASAQAGAKEPVVKEPEPVLSGARIFTWRKNLINAIMRANDCACYSTHRQRELKYYAFGRADDLAAARYMFGFAESEIYRLCRLHCKGQGHSYADSWCMGAVDGIKDQLAAVKAAGRVNVSCTALVLLNNREKEAKNEMYRVVPNLRPVTNYWNGQRDGGAYNYGRVIGATGIDLNGRGVGALPGSPRKLGA